VYKERNPRSVPKIPRLESGEAELVKPDDVQARECFAGKIAPTPSADSYIKLSGKAEELLTELSQQADIVPEEVFSFTYTGGC